MAKLKIDLKPLDNEGRHHGIWSYHCEEEPNDICFLVTFRHGLMHGLYEYYGTNEVMIRGFNRNGRKHGVWVYQMDLANTRYRQMYQNQVDDQIRFVLSGVLRIL